MSNQAIIVSNISKTFRIPHETANSVKSLFLHPFRRHRYDTQKALRDVSFTIEEGEFFGIVGRNGSGKSTLLKLIAGIYSPDIGEITVNGKLTPFIELGVGFNPELSGRENVYLSCSLLGFNRKETAKMYDDIVEFAELKKFMDLKLKNYSSGMLVRLAFSIAVRVKSDVLLLDEVLAVGDAAFQQKCYNYFNYLKETKRTVILVTHNMAHVEKFCDRALLLHQGKIITMGSTKDVAEGYLKLNKQASEVGTQNYT